MEKVVNEYGGNYGKLVDLVRCSIVVSSEEQLESVVRALVGSDEGDDQPAAFEVVRCKVGREGIRRRRRRRGCRLHTTTAVW